MNKRNSNDLLSSENELLIVSLSIILLLKTLTICSDSSGKKCYLRMLLVTIAARYDQVRDVSCKLIYDP